MRADEEFDGGAPAVLRIHEHAAEVRAASLERVVVADRFYCSFMMIALLVRRGVNVCARLHQRRHTDFRRGKRLSPDERLVQWKKPKVRGVCFTPEQWAALPDMLTLRVVRCRMARRGFRTQQIILHESGVASTVDPVGGAYAIEEMTNRIERDVADALARIDAMGGTLAAIESGYIQRQIHDSAYAAQRAVDAGETIVVGVNRFQRLHEALPADLRDITLDDIDWSELHRIAESEKTANLSPEEKKKRSLERKAVREELKDLVLRGGSAMEIKREAVRLGMKTLRQAGLSKVEEGVTTLEEVRRVTAPD